MRNISYLTFGVLAFGSMIAPVASGTVAFFDDFEDEPVSNSSGSPAIGAPVIGTWVEGATSGARGADIASSPAIGTRSMRLLREGVPPLGPSNGQMTGISLDGVIEDGNVFEVKWSVQLTAEGAVAHRYNNPMQMAIGHVGSNFSNDLAFILVGDANSGSYHYSNSTSQYQGSTSTAIQPSLGAWDTLRAVFTINQISETQMGGTYDLFLSLAGGPEQQLADNATAFTTTIPDVDATKLQLRVVKGPSSAWIYYDDISVTVVPEPSVLALGAVGGMFALRRKRK